MKSSLTALTFLASTFGHTQVPFAVSDGGNGHLSAIYHSQEFDLRSQDGRIFKFTQNGKKLTFASKSYNCKVSKHGHSWGSSEMSLQCEGDLRQDNLFLFIISELEGNKITGLILMGKDVNI